jgi:hypothetical protein
MLRNLPDAEFLPEFFDTGLADGYLERCDGWPLSHDSHLDAHF